MSISVGDNLPDAELLVVGENGPETVSISTKTKGRNVVIFGLPGAYTGICTSAHVPSFIRTRTAFGEKGVDEVICVSVNDPFVMDAWGKDTGALEGGITMLADSASAFTNAIGLVLDAPAVGLHNRSLRYAMYAEDGVVKACDVEENPGVCELSAGETLLEKI